MSLDNGRSDVTMRLSKLSEFRLSVYCQGSRPDPRTLRSRIERGLIPGGFKDEMGRYWVDMDLFEAGPLGRITDPLVRRAIGL